MLSTVDWAAIGRTMKGVSRGRRVFVTKHMSGMCGIGKFRKRWKQWEIDQCPRCGEKEDAPYLVPGNMDVCSTSTASMKNLQKWDCSK
jgi:hypothetical protein